ncbi:MAG: hypothetical protein ACOH2N_04210 [Devosia sp.]|jgi:NADH:ubiquinone oxidoreductase subunit 6 (subunit J)
MNFLTPLTNLLGLEIDHVTDNIKRAVIINAIMLILGLLGAGFLVAAGFMALALEVGSIYAALIFAGICLLLTLVVYVGMRIGQARRKRQAAQKRRSDETSTLLTTATFAAVPVLLRSPLVRTLGLPAAAIAAFLLVSRHDDASER